jgi:hypothetical protein
LGTIYNARGSYNLINGKKMGLGEKLVKSFCSYKFTNGIKRHLCMDTLGNILFIHCTPVNISDDKDLVQILVNNLSYFKQKPVNTKKITILLDNGYH